MTTLKELKEEHERGLEKLAATPAEQLGLEFLVVLGIAFLLTMFFGLIGFAIGAFLVIGCAMTLLEAKLKAWWRGTKPSA